MKNKGNLQEINNLLSVLNSKIRDIDRKRPAAEAPVFGTKIFKNPELIFKKKEDTETKLPPIRPPLAKSKGKTLPKRPERPQREEKAQEKAEKDPKRLEKPSSLEEVEDRIKAIHLKSEDALMRFVEIRQDLMKSKENRGVNVEPRRVSLGGEERRKGKE